MNTFADIAQFLLTVSAVGLVLAPLVLLARMEHVARRRGGSDDDADARRVAAELRAIDTATAPVPELRGRRHAWVSRAR